MGLSAILRTLSRRASLTLGLLAIAGATVAASARAEACPGSGSEPCPYRAWEIIGRRAEGVLRFPEAVALDPAGDVYVADQLGYAVQKFSAAGAFEGEWGSYGGGHGQFGPIAGLATDAAGDVYVVDSSHNRIEKFDAAGNFITSWGGHGSALGRFNFGSSQNPTQPPGGGIAVAGAYVYVADSGNNRVERFDLQGGEAMQWGTKGSGAGQFRYPRGVAANESEVIVSDDDNHRVEKFDPNGGFEAAAGGYGTGPGQFSYPYGVALDAAGNVYVADDSADRIVELTPRLTFATSWGSEGSAPGQLAFPRALASGPTGETYVADTANHRIQVFDPNGSYLRSFGISARAATIMTAPRGLATDPAGRLYVSDTVGNRIEVFQPGNDAWWGEWTSAGGVGGSFNAPAGIAVDPLGSIYVADPGNRRIVHLWGDGTYLSELSSVLGPGAGTLSAAGSVAIAPAQDWAYVADTNNNRILVYDAAGALIARWGADRGGGAAGSAPGEFSHPAAVASDAAGDAYVADRGNDRIVKLSPSGGVLRTWGSAGAGNGRFSSPNGIALDAAGHVYVLDGANNRVQVFDSNGRFLAKWGLRGTVPGAFARPSAIALDCSGRVYVADTDNNRVQRFEMVSPAAAGCLPAQVWPPPLDVAPVLGVSLARRSSVLARRALALNVSCQRGCTVSVSATLRPRGRGRALRVIPMTRALPPGPTGHVRLRVGAGALRGLRRELGRRRGLLARVRIVATGPTGKRTTLSRTYRVTR
jgi:DNA-binding beta-propeller fold protein YncE